MSVGFDAFGDSRVLVRSEVVRLLIRGLVALLLCAAFPSAASAQQVYSPSGAVNVNVAAPVGLTPIGVGVPFAAPTSGTATVPVALGTAPATATSFGFYIPAGASIQYGFGTSAAAAAAAAASGLITASNPSSATIFWPDNFAGGLTVYVGAVSGAVLARYF